MSLDPAILNGHLDRVMTDLPIAFTWNGAAFSGARTTPDQMQEAEIGGLDQKVQFNLYIRRSDLPTIRPGIGAIFVMEGVSYKVLEIAVAPDGNLLRYAMGFARVNSMIET